MKHLEHEITESSAGRTGLRPGAWLHSLLLRNPGRLMTRLGWLAARLQQLSRGQRRWFGRAAAGTLAGVSGIALLAMLAGPMAPPARPRC